MAIKYKVKQGDTLNAIAQRHGFKNYKEAGISEVPSGNFDLIRPDEEITLGNYDPNEIKGVSEGSPVISSTDSAQGFKSDSSTLDSLLGSLGTVEKTDSADKSVHSSIHTDTTDFDSKGTGEGEGGSGTTTGSDVLDSINKDIEAKSKAEIAKAEAKVQARKDLYTTSLASIDATTNATIAGIKSTYDKSISQQKRINDLNIARVKAYGLSKGGQYVPIQFSDAVSNREIEASNKINELESKRQSLIAQAKSARDTGQAKLLRERLDDLDKIDENLRSTLKDIEAEVKAQFELREKIIADEEAKHEQEVEKMRANLATIAPKLAEDYDKLDDSQKDAFIKKFATKTGLDYATVYGIMESASATLASSETDALLNEAKLASEKALATQRNASANASNALAEKRRRVEEGGSDFSESEVRKLEQAGLKDASRERQLDYLYGDDVEKEEAKQGSGQTFTDPDGNTWEFEGLTSQEIQQLKDAGYKQN